MAILPLPSKQAPADTSILYDIIKAINDLSESFGRLGSTSTFKDKTLPTNALQVVAKTLSVVSNKQVTGTEEEQFIFEYPDFSSLPVVVFTPVVGSTNATQRNVSVTLTNTTTTRSTGVIKFTTPGIFTVDINAVAIGISPTYRG